MVFLALRELYLQQHKLDSGIDLRCTRPGLFRPEFLSNS